MFRTLSKLVIFASLVFIAYLTYEIGFHNDFKTWVNVGYHNGSNWIRLEEPTPAAYTSLDEEEKIFEKFNNKPYEGIGVIDPDWFAKKNIFQSIEPLPPSR